MTWLIADTAGPEGFRPAPDHAALLTGLVSLAAAAGVSAADLVTVGARRLAELLGVTCVVSLLHESGRWLEPLAVADTDPDVVAVLEPLVGSRLPATPGAVMTPGSEELAAYVERFGMASGMVAPMRAGGRVIGTVAIIRREGRPGWTPMDEQLTQAAADVLALGVRSAPTVDFSGTPVDLSPREREILALLTLGHTNREVAAELELSVRTVEWHRARIQTKLGVTGRAALARVARAHGVA